ncbi:uncharacterized protein LOC123551578 [Mercenaria mercenaria]|uniref:uncharacterized protein LOC123551578 n=1 Tax=Mercenaria mercenaria TaxID=6596 RepID=UPI00234EDDAC|nr:uncharacterized protein LOC123551578 [Mercenaria mercenaria]
MKYYYHTAFLLFVCCVQVALCLRAHDIVAEANKHIDWTKWAKSSSYSSRFGPGTNKCNLFVYDVLKAVGADPPSRHWYIYSPISAAEWGNPSSSALGGKRCWNVCTGGQQNGDVISDTVHVGIVTGYHLTTSAATYKVERGNWGYRSSGEFGSSDSITGCWRYDYNGC